MSLRSSWCLGLFVAFLALACGCSRSGPGATPPTRRVIIIPEEQTSGTAEETIPQRTAEFVTNQGQRVKLAIDGDPWADRVVSSKPGNPAAQDATDPKGTLGKPDYEPAQDDSKTYLAMGHGGELIVEFVDNVLIDGDGDDLAVFEIGPAVEPIDVAISVDGTDWIEVGQVEGASSTLDIGPVVKPGQRFHFVRLTDARAGRSNGTPYAGADLDAVGAISTLSLRTKP